MDFYSKLLERVNQAGTFSTNSRICVTRIEQGCAEGVLHAGVTAVERCSELFFILEIGTVAPERFGFLVEKRTRDVEKRRN